MLIETPYKNGDTITIKLVGGDEVVARFDDSAGPDEIKLIKPMVVMMAQQGFGFMPYVLTADPDTKITIPRSQILAIVKTHKPVADAYIKQTTGLTI